jgi:hypothetical protein
MAMKEASSMPQFFEASLDDEKNAGEWWPTTEPLLFVDIFRKFVQFPFY